MLEREFAGEVPPPMVVAGRRRPRRAAVGSPGRAEHDVHEPSVRGDDDEPQGASRATQPRNSPRCSPRATSTRRPRARKVARADRATWRTDAIEDWVEQQANAWNDNLLESISILPNSIDTGMWHGIIYPEARAICVLRGRSAFLELVEGVLTPCGQPRWGARWSTTGLTPVGLSRRLRPWVTWRPCDEGQEDALRHRVRDG
jgi:hypothetical protein